MKNENDDDVMLREGKREGFYCKRHKWETDSHTMNG
jgi:hypothetical protein